VQAFGSLLFAFVNIRMRLRELPPGSAWNEAMRRSMVISIGGFFVPNVLANFGVIPQLHDSFQFMPGICGAAGVFFAAMGLFLGYFHQKWLQGAVVAIAGLVLPYAATWLWFRTTQPGTSAALLQLFGPTIITSIVSYVAFMLWHARLSNSTFDGLSGQLVADDYGAPKSRWERVIFKACLVIGSVLLLLLLFLSTIGGH